MYSVLIFITLLTGQITGQYGELASLIGGSLAPGILGNVPGVSGLLGNIATLYQIAQGALQLTGTGVGILNQASEGKWFNTMLEETRNANREFQERRLSGNGLEPDYSPFGINFPAPSSSDYDHEEFVKLEGLIPINAHNISNERSITTTKPPITLFPEEKETGKSNEKEIQNSLMGNFVTDFNENGAETDRFENKETTEWNSMEVFNSYHDHDEQKLVSLEKKSELAKEKIKKLQQFILLLHESNITENDLNEMTRFLESQKRIKSKLARPTTKTKAVSISSTTVPTFRRIEEANKLLATAFPMKLDEMATENEDSDLLPTTRKAQARAVGIEWGSRIQPKSDLMLTTFRPHRKFPRRTAYTARLPLTTRTTRSTKPEKSKHSEANIANDAGKIAQIQSLGRTNDLRSKQQPKEIPSQIFNHENDALQQKPYVLEQQFSNPSVLNPIGRQNIPLTYPIFRSFPTSALLSQFPSKALNAIESYSSHLQFLGNNKNSLLWPHQYPSHISGIYRLGQLNAHTNSNGNLLIPPFHNDNPS
uniref:Uncharacterized protein n=1 Tax=Setaria digitata TaxID=48799 RepID=A0A915PDN4_9BILA